MGLLFAGWRVWIGVHNPSPQLRFLLLSVNGQPHKLVPGEETLLKPEDLLKLLKLSTNVPFNIGIRLYSKGVDINALWYEELSVRQLLGPDLIFQNPLVIVEVKHFNRHVATVKWKVQTGAEDWLEKTGRIIDPNKRIALLERALKLFPENAALCKRLAKEYISQKRWYKAIKLLEELAKETPEEETLYILLDLYKKVGDKGRSIATLKRLLNMDPHDLGLRWQLAESLEKADRISEAVQHYEVILSKTPEKERLDLYQHLGYLYTKVKDYKKALSYYLKALKLAPKDPGIYETLAVLYDRMGKRQKADHFFEKAIDLKGEDHKGRLKLALRLIERKRYKEAKAHLHKILAKQASMKALLLMVDVAEKLGDKKELKATYRKILKLNPKKWVILFNLAALEYEDGNLKKARLLLEQYLKARPKDKDAHLLLFDVYKGLGQKAKAYREAITCLSFDPGNLHLNTYVFQYLKETKNYTRMAAVLKEAIKVNPKEVILREYLLFAYIQMGKEKETMDVMKDILKMKPNNPRLWLSLGKLQEKKGLYKEAMASYKRVLDLWPENDEAGEGYLRVRLKVVQGGE